MDPLTDSDVTMGATSDNANNNNNTNHPNIINNSNSNNINSSSLPPSSPSSVPMNPELNDRINKFRSDCLDNLYHHQCHNLIPHSGKVVVFDSKLRVKHAFDGLLVHDINCAPVYDSNKRKYVGMLSVSDFLDILLQTYNESDKNSTAFQNLSNQRILDWAEFKKSRGTSINRLLCISPESTLHEAVRQLLNYRVHRLCVVQLALADTVLRILTNHGILRFLRNNCKSLDTVTVRDLGIGVFKNLLTLTYQTPLMKALEMLYSYKVSSIPIVNEHSIPVDLYSRSDVRFLAMDNNWTNLDITLEQALNKHQKGRALPLCTRDDTIATVAGLLVSTMKHSLICVDPVTGIIEGVVSLTDILSFLLNSGPPKAESRIAALKNENNENIDPQAMIEATNRQNRLLNSISTTTYSQPNSPAIRPKGNNNNNNTLADIDPEQMGDIDPDEDFLR